VTAKAYRCCVQVRSWPLGGAPEALGPPQFPCLLFIGNQAAAESGPGRSWPEHSRRGVRKLCWPLARSMESALIATCRLNDERIHASQLPQKAWLSPQRGEVKNRPRKAPPAFSRSAHLGLFAMSLSCRLSPSGSVEFNT